MEHITLQDVPVETLITLKQCKPDPYPTPCSQGKRKQKERVLPSRFKPLKTRSQESRKKRIQQTFTTTDETPRLSLDYEQQKYHMRLQAIDYRLNTSIEQMKLFENMQSLRMDRSLIHGWGLFATRDIPANEPVIEYTGELIRLQVVDRRQAIYEKQGNLGSYIFRLDNGGLYIDATVTGGPAKFINHSCDPNCASKNMFFDGQEHIVIFSIRNISRGEELTYDYKLDYEGEDKRIQCMCGAKNCKQWLNWHEEKKPDEGQVVIKSYVEAYQWLLKEEERLKQELEKAQQELEKAQQEQQAQEAQQEQQVQEAPAEETTC